MINKLGGFGAAVVTRRPRYEDDAMRIVEAVKREHAPSMDENDGGELLHAILTLVEKAAADAARLTVGADSAAEPPKA